MNYQYRELNILSWLAVFFIIFAAFVFLGVNKAEAANPYIQNVFFGQDEQGNYISFDWVGVPPVTDNSWFGCRRDLVAIWFNRFDPKGANTGNIILDYVDGDFVGRFNNYSGFGSYAFASGLPNHNCATNNPDLSQELPRHFKVYINPLLPPERFSFTGNDFITIQLLGWNYNAQFIEVLAGDTEEYHYQVPENPLPAIPYTNIKFGFNKNNQLNVSFDWIAPSKAAGFLVGFNGRVHDSVFTERHFTPDVGKDVSMTWEQGGNLNFGYVDPLGGGFFEKGNHYELSVKWLEKWTPVFAHKTNCSSFFWYLCGDPISKEVFEDFLGRSLNSDDYITITSYFNDPNKYYFVAENDIDGDALLDSWEENGFDFNNDGIVDVDLRAMGARKDHKDIFVYANWLEDESFFGHSHRPDEESMNKVIEAFANAPVDNPDGATGINLHIITGGKIAETAENKEIGTINEEICDYSWNEFDSLIKVNHFPKKYWSIFHYVFFGHYLPEYPCLNGRPAGISRNNTDNLHAFKEGAGDLIVAMGDWEDFFGDLFWESETLKVKRATAFMHELGHNLGLGHGGLILDQDGRVLNADHVRYKPNYLSVMNYSFRSGLIKRNYFGLFTTGNFDYSRFDKRDIPDLIEKNLNEVSGLVATDVVKDYGTIFYCQNSGEAVKVNGLLQSVDWNCDEDKTDVNVATDINKDNIITDGIAVGPDFDGDGLPDTVMLSTVNEWQKLTYRGGSIGDLSGDFVPPTKTSLRVLPEITLREDLSLGLQIVGAGVKIDIKPDSYPNSINLKSKGVIPVVIFGTNEFNVNNINVNTVSLAGASVKLNGDNKPIFSIEDIDGDGIADLFLHIATEQLSLTKKDAIATLVGKTNDEMTIYGSDSVKIIP